MITVTVVDTGDYYLKKKTIQSLGGQETHSDICLWNVREDSFRESLTREWGKIRRKLPGIFFADGNGSVPGRTGTAAPADKKDSGTLVLF